jgi:hypothetical protein
MRLELVWRVVVLVWKVVVSHWSGVGRCFCGRRERREARGAVLGSAPGCRQMISLAALTVTYDSTHPLNAATRSGAQHPSTLHVHHATGQ